MPVPTAVPPCARQCSRGRHDCGCARSTSSICVRQPPSSWPSVIGIASIRCVRPVFTVSPTSAALRPIVSDSSCSAGSSCSAIASAALRWIAVGNRRRCCSGSGSRGRSDAPASPPAYAVARCAITSFAFMLVLVPEPVWNTSTGNCASCRPSATSSAACWMAARPHRARGRRVRALAPAAAHLIRPRARMKPARHRAGR